MSKKRLDTARKSRLHQIHGAPEDNSLSQ